MTPAASPPSSPFIPIRDNDNNNNNKAVSHPSSNLQFLVLLIIGAATILLAATLYFCVWRRLYPILRRCRARKKLGKFNEDEMMLRRFKLDELEKATDNFSQDCLIGSGAFGKVYKGTFEEGRILAIKKAHADSYQSVDEFRNEVMLLSKVKHRNLVGLVGFCEEAGAKMLVYEYAPNGSLLEYIMGRRDPCLTWKQRVTLAIGAAKGIAHLHEEVKPSIIHRDLKPSNILIGNGFQAKISDFGLVKSGPVGDESHVSSQIKGTPGYLDPAYCSTFHLTPFSDVYSFGVILLQLISARPAVDATNNNSKYHIIEWARPSLEKGSVEDILDANLLLEQCNMEMMLKMGQLGLRCVAKVPKQRPTMTEVWRELEEALYSADSKLIRKHTSRSLKSSSAGASRRSLDCRHLRRLSENDPSHSFVSIDGVRLQRFHVEMDGLSFQSASLRWLEDNSISLDIDRISEESRIEGT